MLLFLVSASVRNENRSEVRTKSQLMLSWSSKYPSGSFWNPLFPAFPQSAPLTDMQIRLSKLPTCERFSALSSLHASPFFSPPHFLLSAKCSASHRAFGCMQIWQKSKSFKNWWILPPSNFVIFRWFFVSAHLIGLWPTSIGKEDGWNDIRVTHISLISEKSLVRIYFWNTAEPAGAVIDNDLKLHLL